MKVESINQAYANLDKYTLNEESLKELNKLTTDGVELKIPNETISDRFINFFDKKRVILDKKVNILHKFYANTTLAKDLVFDQHYDTTPIRYLRNSAVLGLVSYNAYSSVIYKSPFLKTPGLIAGLVGIHAIERHFTNEILEARIRTPWKIHVNRMSKGLGPTNYYGYINLKEQYGNQYLQQHRAYTENNYLHLEKINSYSLHKDIYYKENIFENKYNIINPITDNRIVDSFYFTEKESNKENEKYTTRFTDTRNDTDFENAYKEEEVTKETENEKLYRIGKEKRRNFMKYIHYNDLVLAPQTTLKYDTFNANNGNEPDLVNNRINYTNEYDNVLEFASSDLPLPSYTKIFTNEFNFNEDEIPKFLLDFNLNYNLKTLKRKIHFMRNFGASEEEVRIAINNFNKENKSTMQDFKLNQDSSVNDNAPKESFLIHSAKEEEHLKKYFDFMQKNKIAFSKTEEEDDTYEEFVDEENYDPWVEYKKTYGDLLKKGRKYFIVSSIPEWKFLQVRKPKIREEEISPNSARHPNFRDSIFNIISLERYHLERQQKMNIHHNDTHSHKI